MQHEWKQPVKKCLARQENDGVTAHALLLFEDYRRELRSVAFVELLMPFGSEQADSRTRFIDSLGNYIELDGFSWGYGGEGPNGLAKAFRAVGIPITIGQIAGWNMAHYILDCEVPAVHFLNCHCQLFDRRST